MRAATCAWRRCHLRPAVRPFIPVHPPPRCAGPLTHLCQRLCGPRKRKRLWPLSVVAGPQAWVSKRPKRGDTNDGASGRGMPSQRSCCQGAATGPTHPPTATSPAAHANVRVHATPTERASARGSTVAMATTPGFAQVRSTASQPHWSGAVDGVQPAPFSGVPAHSVRNAYSRRSRMGPYNRGGIEARGIRGEQPAACT